MKYVYVLVSNIEDYYYEQCFISINSLLKHNPGAEVVLVVDNLTNANLVKTRQKIRKYVTEIIVYNFAQNVSAQMRSRLLKTMTRQLIKGNFMYIDNDTIIVDSLDDIMDFQGDIGLILDKHVPISRHYLYKYLESNAKKAKFSIGFEDKHFNGGVMFASDTPKAHEFYALWNKLYIETVKKGIYVDQTSLNEANVRLQGVITELTGEWNVQINCGMQYLYNAKIIHYLGYQPFNRQNIYFNTLPFLLCDERYFKEMKENGNITNKIQKIIDNPQIAFKTVAIIPDDCIAYNLLFSNHLRILKFIYVKFNKVYETFEKIYEYLFIKIFKRV